MTAEMVKSGKALVMLERNRVNRERGREERNRAYANRFGNAKTPNVRLGGLEPTEYGDREPIMGHQDNDGLMEEGLLATDESQMPTSSSPQPKHPSLSDLEFGSAFSTNTTRTFNQQPAAQPTSIGGNEGRHPTPSSIFDDL
jgi:hypothetical protein